jgi:hypothetical protein
VKRLVVSFSNFVNKRKNGKRYRKKTPEWIATDGLEKVAEIVDFMMELK